MAPMRMKSELKIAHLDSKMFIYTISKLRNITNLPFTTKLVSLVTNLHEETASRLAKIARSPS